MSVLSWGGTEVCTFALRAEQAEAGWRQVAPGGTLLIVGHHPSDPQATSSHASAPEVHFTAEEVAASLDPHRWDIAIAEARTRSAAAPDGHEVTMRDAVLRARKRP